MCHLAWLIRDNRHMLHFVSNATCSNGVKFKMLDPSSYDICPVSSHSNFKINPSLCKSEFVILLKNGAQSITWRITEL